MDTFGGDFGNKKLTLNIVWHFFLKSCFIYEPLSLIGLNSLMFICVDYHFTFRTLHEGVVKLDACTCQVIICLRFKALLHYQDVTKDTFLVTKIEGGYSLASKFK